LPGDQSHVTNRLAQFVAGSRWDTIPSEVRHEGVREFLNFVGCALGGAQDEAMGVAIKVLTPFFGPPQGIVIGRGDRPDTLNAAFLNTVSANVLEYWEKASDHAPTWIELADAGESRVQLRRTPTTGSGRSDG
jgi:2-methylcitrate dehydratase PrpD